MHLAIEGFNIREISAQDCTSLEDFLESNNLPAVTRHFHPFPLTAETARDVACTPRRDRFYAAFLHERIVGFCMLRGWEEGYLIPSYGVLIDIAFQSQGLGRTMTEFAISEAKELACPQVRLSVYASNERAMHLYSSLGFTEQEREQRVVMGEPDEKIVMTKQL